MRLTYEAILNNPQLLAATLANARRERANAVHDLVIEAIKRLSGLRMRASPSRSTHVQARPA